MLITGASRGIGREIAKVFSKNCYKVVLNYFKSEKEAKNLEKELRNSGCDALAVCANVVNYLEVQNMVKEAISFLGRIDTLVNNAGISIGRVLGDTSEEDWNEIFDVNVKGTFNCCKSVLPEMIERKKGKIVNVSSILGIVGGSCEVAYSASKAAIVGFTKALAKEVGPCNININCVAPGLIDTEMNKNLNKNDLESLRGKTSLCRIGTVQDVANAVLFLSSEEANFITGQILQVDGGLVI